MSQKHSFIVPGYGFLRLPQVLAIFPISKSVWWEGCRTGRYPKPIKLGPRTTVWRAEDIKAFIERVSCQLQSEGGNE
jgi:prophage regulatory protein